MAIRKIIKQLGIILFFLLTSIICLAAFNPDEDKSSENGSVDVIFIESSQTGMKDQMSKVLFLHDLHTDALKDNNCSTCHLKNDAGGFTFNFLETANKENEKRMDMFHDNCIGCHNEMKKEGKHSGPDTENCRACHQEEPDISLTRSKLQFDRSLHYRHESSTSITPTAQGMPENCGNCHHEYDETIKKTVYMPGKESACIYCHLEKDTEKARSIETVSHESCLNCHKQLMDKKIDKTGPIRCEGCHSTESRKKIKTVSDVPRLKRNQPDSVWMATSVEAAINKGEQPTLTLLPVAFNHKLHENAAETCKKCHHRSLDKCSSCHTPFGDKKGEFITLETAMHTITDGESCMGCHHQTKSKKECSGCHTQMGIAKTDESTCNSCHNAEIMDISAFPATDEAQKKWAHDAVTNRKLPELTYTEKEVPEKVSIGIMKNEYEPAELPHRKIVNTLLSGINEGQIGIWFHKDKYAMCKGCHHNSPMETGTPPACATCHVAAPMKSTKNGRPGLKGAYHGQCIGCHNQMNIDKPAATDCIGCHKKRT